MTIGAETKIKEADVDRCNTSPLFLGGHPQRGGQPLQRALTTFSLTSTGILATRVNFPGTVLGLVGARGSDTI